MIFSRMVISHIAICLPDFQVNRNPIADEMKRMRQQLEYLQAELVLARGGVGSDDVQVMLCNLFAMPSVKKQTVDAVTHIKHYNDKRSICRVSGKGSRGLNTPMKTFAGNYMAFAVMFTLIHVNLNCTYVNEFLSMVLDILHLKTHIYLHFHCSFHIACPFLQRKKGHNDITHCLLLLFHVIALEMVGILYVSLLVFALYFRKLEVAMSKVKDSNEACRVQSHLMSL